MTPIVCTRLCCARRSVVVVVVVESLRSVGGQQRVQAWLGRLVLVAQLPGPLSVGRGLSLHVPRARPTARTARFHRLPTATRPRRPDTYPRTQVSTPVGRKSNGGGVFFVKKWTFPRRRVHHVQYQYFLFYILLIWGGAYAPNAPPCLRAWVSSALN